LTSGSGKGRGGARPPERCGFCGSPAEGGLRLFRAAGPDGPAVCWFCARSTLRLAIRNALPLVRGASCSFCGEPAEAPPAGNRPGRRTGRGGEGRSGTGPASKAAGKPDIPAGTRPDARPGSQAEAIGPGGLRPAGSLNGASPGSGAPGGGAPMASGPGGTRLCPECAWMLMELAQNDDPYLHLPPGREDDSTAPPVWFGLLGGFSPLTLVYPGAEAAAPGREAVPKAPAAGPGRRGRVSPGRLDIGRSRQPQSRSVCAVCGEPHQPSNPVFNISRNEVPALDICDSCLRTAAEIFWRIRIVPSRRGAACSVCGRPPSPENPVLSLPGRGRADICRECCQQLHFRFGRFRLAPSGLEGPPELRFPPGGRLPGSRGPFAGSIIPPPPSSRPRRLFPEARPGSLGYPPSPAPGSASPPAPAGPGQDDLPRFEKAMLQRHSNWRITSIGRVPNAPDQGPLKPCCFCGRQPSDGKEMIVLGTARTDLRICADCVRVYSSQLKTPRPGPAEPDSARCSLCGLPPRQGIGMITGSFPRRLRLCGMCIEALESMIRRPARQGAAPAGPAADGPEGSADGRPESLDPSPADFAGADTGPGPSAGKTGLSGQAPGPEAGASPEASLPGASGEAPGASKETRQPEAAPPGPPDGTRAAPSEACDAPGHRTDPDGGEP
jgi:hypothetical protein